jgi:outer membrane biosynthesis protein TonB
MNTDRRLRSLQLTTFALTAAGSLAACGAANTPESATPAAAEEAAQTPAPPAEPTAPAAPAPAYEQTPQQQQPPEPSSKPQETAGNEQAAPEKKDPEPTSVTITTLSKGRGVPAPTRDAYKQIRGLLEEQQNQSAVTNIDTQRIGIEGEMRMCAEFRDRDQAEYTLEQIRKISADVELINVVEGPCPPTQRDKP